MSRVSDLRSLLERHRAPEAEAEAVASSLRLLDTGDDSLSADHYVPGHVTASAFVVDRTRTRLLLIHHGKLRLWLQPGGHVDPGEDVPAAAIREVHEETGVVGVPIDTGVFDVDVHPIPASDGRPRHNHYDVRFLLEASSEDLVDSDEVLGVRWVPFDEVGEIVTDLSVLRATEKLVSRWG